MKHYEDQARMQVNNALQTGVKEQAVNRRLAKRKQTRKAKGGFIMQLRRLLVGKVPKSRQLNTVLSGKRPRTLDLPVKGFGDDDVIDTGVT